MNLQQLLQDPASKIIDVRSAGEFNAEHINGAINIPLDQVPARTAELEKLGKAPIIFYCRSGNRSGMAVDFLQQLGYSNVYNGGSIDYLKRLLN
ncbi:rhodanese-like domain-containing protein [Panacibacter sp. DH6]|uniref:Rhodanese-like domain-containing protein n=1 Tax=Panacibacter microcysteis TaxID=2793269 RepID=A0A931E464_9BACT|nr:rhodanese-like domain-containing protein [Panacibacter microcysteis]MBG9374648.1 rhodanese-like domain-containing protein [Panacibacter microcysteis]